jgi:hypothetical protein
MDSDAVIFDITKTPVDEIEFVLKSKKKKS